jgi:hypothetical protein
VVVRDGQLLLLSGGQLLTLGGDPGAVSGSVALAAVGAVEGATVAGDTLWVTGRSCARGEDLPERSLVTVCPFDAAGAKAAPCLYRTFGSCATVAVSASNNRSALFAFEGGAGPRHDGPTWMVPLARAAPGSADLRAARLLWNLPSVPLRRLRCTRAAGCDVLTAEPRSYLSVGEPASGPPPQPLTRVADPKEESFWRPDAWAALGLFQVRGDTVSFQPVRQDLLERAFVIADRFAPDGIDLVAAHARTSSYVAIEVGVDGAPRWEQPSSVPAVAAFTEAGGVRIFSDQLDEQEISSTGGKPWRSVRPAEYVPWPGRLVRCGDGYLLRGETEPWKIWRYRPGQDARFAGWTESTSARGAAEPTWLACGGGVVVAAARSAEMSALPGAPVVFRRWTTAGQSLPPLDLNLATPDLADLPAMDRGDQLVVAAQAPAEGPRSARLRVWTVGAQTLGTAEVPLPASARFPERLRLSEADGDALAAAWCDRVSGDCWVTRWTSSPRR